jgi:hypothetical protein
MLDFIYKKWLGVHKFYRSLFGESKPKVVVNEEYLKGFVERQKGSPSIRKGKEKVTQADMEAGKPYEEINFLKSELIRKEFQLSEELPLYRIKVIV